MALRCFLLFPHPVLCPYRAARPQVPVQTLLNNGHSAEYLLQLFPSHAVSVNKLRNILPAQRLPLGEAMYWRYVISAPLEAM